LLKPIPIARSAEMIQTVISVAVTGEIKKQNVLATTLQLLSNSGHRVFHNRPRLAQTDEAGDRWVITVPACNGDRTM
jgi:hypothetical protein